MSNEELRQLRQMYIQTELEYSELKIKYAELQKQYNELNKFTNSQCYKLLIQEEKVEEYAQNEINKMFVDESEEVYIRASTLKQIIKNSHLKGLAEGKPKWHDLRKNPNDLPKDNQVLKEYLVAYQNFNNPNEIVVGCFTWNGARFLENYDYSEIPYFENKNVLFAWCELPKFEE